MAQSLQQDVLELLALGQTPDAFFVAGHEPLVPVEGGYSFRGIGYGPLCDRLWDTIHALADIERQDYLDDDHTFARNRERLTEWLPTAELDDVCRYLTYLSRGERFADGLQANHIQNGNVFIALRRLAQLTAQLPDDGQDSEL